jgi:hypothetical protein
VRAVVSKRVTIGVDDSAVGDHLRTENGEKKANHSHREISSFENVANATVNRAAANQR